MRIRLTLEFIAEFSSLELAQTAASQAAALLNGEYVAQPAWLAFDHRPQEPRPGSLELTASAARREPAA